MDFDFFDSDQTWASAEVKDGNDDPEKIFLALWRNPFCATNPEKVFARDPFANFTLSLVGVETEYHFSKSVISGLSNKVCQMLINDPEKSEWVIDLKMEPTIFHRGMQILAGLPRVPFLIRELPQLYCLLNYIDVFDTSFKSLILSYITKNCSEEYILGIIQTFISLNHALGDQKLIDDFLEILMGMRFQGFRDLECKEPLSLETFERILDYHQNQRMKILFAHDANAQQEDVFLSDKEVEFVIENYVDKYIHPLNKASTKLKLMERFLPKEKKPEFEEIKHDELFLRKKNQELEERVEKLTQIVSSQQAIIDSHTEHIKKLTMQLEALLKNQNYEKQEMMEDPRDVAIRRACEFTDAAEYKFEGLVDAICIQVNHTVKLMGIEACLPGEKGITAAGEMGIYEWDYFQLGQEIARLDVVLDYKEGEKSAMLWLEKNVILKADRTYCITCKMFGGPTYACKSVKPFVSTKGLNVVFIEPDSLIEQFKIGANIFPGFYLQKVK